MNNAQIDPHDDDMRSEYDFSGVVRGKHYRSFQRGYVVGWRSFSRTRRLKPDFDFSAS